MPLNAPNILTLVRILLVPLMVVAFYWPAPYMHVVAGLLFTLGALTDWLDGWWARRTGQTSAFGAFLDPVADKLAVTVALFLVVQAGPTPLMALVAAVIVGREITISALREWMAGIGAASDVRVAGLGKIKTIVQMVAIVMLLIRESLFGLPVYQIGQALLVVAAVLTLWSGFVYLRAAWPHMRSDRLRSD